MLIRSDGLRLVVAIAIAMLLTLAYFMATQSWTNLANPIPGLVAVFSGVAGFAYAAFVGRLRRRSASPETADRSQE